MSENSPSGDQLIVSRYRAGHSMTAIANELCISRDRVGRVIALAGLPIRRGYKPLKLSITIPAEGDAVRRTAMLCESRGSVVWLRKTENASSARFAVSASPEVAEWLKATFKCGNVYAHGRSGAPRRWAQWEINRTRDTVALLEAMLPFLKKKRAIAIEAIARMRGFL